MSAAKNLIAYHGIDFQLRIEAGPDSGKGFRIHPPKIRIGRDPKNEIMLSDPRASRFQLEITFHDSIVVSDKAGKGSTLINGAPIDTAPLTPGDIISFGNTKIRFVAKGQKHAKDTGLSSTTQRGNENSDFPVKSTKPSGNQSRLLFYGIILILASGVYWFFSGNENQQNQDEFTTSKELTKQIDESKELQKQLKNSFLEKKKRNHTKYQAQIEQHFIRGFRDFQAKKYTRALQAFGAAIAKDPQHTKAHLYSRLARQKREETIERHLLDGDLYRAKLMYDRCASEFEKALVLMNRPSHLKYQLATERIKECNILKQGGQL